MSVAQTWLGCSHRDVRDVGCPDMVGLLDDRVAEQIWEDGMLRIASAGDPLAIQRLNAHAGHQGRDVPPTHDVALGTQQIAQHACTGKRVLQMQPINLAHQLQIKLANRHRLIIQTAA